LITGTSVPSAPLILWAHSPMPSSICLYLSCASPPGIIYFTAGSDSESFHLNPPGETGFKKCHAIVVMPPRLYVSITFFRRSSFVRCTASGGIPEKPRKSSQITAGCEPVTDLTSDLPSSPDPPCPYSVAC